MYKKLAIYKTLGVIIQERLQRKIEDGIRGKRSGFRPTRGCVAQANPLCIIIEQSLEWRTPLHFLFADSKKPIDSNSDPLFCKH